MAAATITGAWLARRRARRQLWLGAAAGALLVIAGLHLLPDAWSAARDTGIWPGAVPAAAAAAFLLMGAAARRGCACAPDTRPAGRAGAAALAVHRFLEGSALALTGSVTVFAALTVHALGEGIGVGALLRASPRRRVVFWLTVMCASPVIGALASRAYPVPATAYPLLLAVAGGVIGRAAWVSLRAAFQGLARSRLIVPGPVAVTTVAAAVTVLAVRAAG